MKRAQLFIVLLALLATACVKPEPVPQGSLSILSGVNNNQLTLGGEQGATTKFSIKSKLAWQVLETKGVSYSPSSGEATEKVEITATATEANNTLQRRKLGDVVIRLDHTRFTGIEALQEPQIIIDQTIGTTLNLPAEQQRETRLEFKCKSDDFEIESNGDITVSKPQSLGENKYRIAICATKDNMTNEQHKAGSIRFKVNGVEQQGEVEVIQNRAIEFSRSQFFINGDAGAQTSVTINSPFDFTIATSSAELTAQKQSNGAVLLTANKANNGSKERLIATLTVTLTNNPNCKATIDVMQRPSRVEKSLMFFMLGTSLSGYYDTNLKMVENVLSSDISGTYRVVVFKQSSTTRGASFEITYDKSLKKIIREPIKEYTLPSQYNEQMATEIFKDLAASSPAKEYGLYIGSHGKGWIPKSTSRASSTLSTASSYDDIWTPAPGAVMVRHIGDNANTQLNIDEFAAAITAAGLHFDYMIFDVCFMSNIESIYTLKDCTDYILASPCEVMASGMPYNHIIPQMLSTGDVKSRLNSASQKYVDYYKTTATGIYSSACSAVIDCSQMEALAQCVKRANNSLKEIDHNTIQAYDGVSSSRNPTHIFYDLEHYLTLSCTDNAALSEFKEQMAITVSGQHNTPTFYSAYNNRANPIEFYSGVTTSAPIVLDPASAYIAEWQQSAWYKATH